MSNNMQNLKIYDIIDQLEDLIENSPKPKLSGSATKRTVDVEEVFDLLGDLKTTIPEDIRRANSLMIEAQNTIDSANDTAQETIDAANTKADAIVAEAQNKANLVPVRSTNVSSPRTRYIRRPRRGRSSLPQRLSTMLTRYSRMPRPMPTTYWQTSKGSSTSTRIWST